MNTFATFFPTKFPNDIIKKILRRVGLSVSECLLCQFLWDVVCHRFCSVIKLLLKVCIFYQKHTHLFEICIQFFCLTMQQFYRSYLYYSAPVQQRWFFFMFCFMKPIFFSACHPEKIQVKFYSIFFQKHRSFQNLK